MAIAVEELNRCHVLPPETEEDYAHAMTTLYRLGRCAVEGMQATVENEAVEQLAWADYITGVAENLKTDAEFSHLLDVARCYEFGLRNGKAVAADGTPMVDVVRRGLAASQAATGKDPSKRIQAVRDKGDVITAEIVDSLQEGETYTVVSMCPEDAMDAGVDMGNLGYVRGLSFIQTYTNVGNKIIARSFSVGLSNKKTWHDVLLRYGNDVPVTTDANTWIRHGIRQSLPVHEALGLAAAIRQEYYEAAGQPHERFSVSEFIDAHTPALQAYFDAYMRPLAQAVYTGTTNETMQSLAASLCGSGIVDALKVDIQRGLERVARGVEAFTTESGQVIESMVRYAVVEALRSKLIEHIVGGAFTEAAYEQPAGQSTWQAYTIPPELLVQHVQGGVSAGRTYAGCSGLNILRATGESSEPTEDIASPQDIYGGRAKENEKGENEECEFVSRECPKCGKKEVKTRVTKTEIIGSCGCKVQKTAA